MNGHDGRVPADVALTFSQKVQLAFGGLPFVTFAVLTALYLAVLPRWIGTPTPALVALLGLVLLVTGYRALARVRDIASGVAIAREDVLARFGRSAAAATIASASSRRSGG